MSSLRDRLTEIRDALGSNAELARAAETTRSNVTQWLRNGVNSLKAETALSIEKNAGYITRWIMYGTGPKRANALKVSEHSDKKGSEIQSDQQKLLEIIRVFHDTDRLGKDAIWAGVQRASKRIADHSKSEKRSTPTLRK